MLNEYNISDSRKIDYKNLIKVRNEFLETRKNKGSLMGFNEKIEFLTNIAYQFNSDQAEQLAWAAVGLYDLFTIFSDRQVTEAFCNEIGGKIVITHRQFGRSLTDVIFSEELWNSLKIQSEIIANEILSPTSPAIKAGFESKLGSLRVSLQIPPLTPLSPAFNIRRLPSEPITLEQLVEQQQIGEKKANILLHALANRENIIVAGEPGSGKTTLANALLLKSDMAWRLIVMEDASELRLSPEEFPMVTRFFMPTVGDDNRFSQRANEIARLLHRSPDYVFLGELQNMEDTKVAFEGFAAGIRGMATTHARSLDGLISRWLDSHSLGERLLQSIDYIAFTRRELINGKSTMNTPFLYRRNDKGQFEEVS